jgi:hypothetical protein
VRGKDRDHGSTPWPSTNASSKKESPRWHGGEKKNSQQKG